MKTLITITALFFFFAASAQKNEYVVKTTGDTLWGQVSIKHNRILLSNDSSITVMTWQPEDIRTINSRHYKGTLPVHCQLRLYTDNITLLEQGWNTDQVADTTLVLEEILTTPKMNLYSATDNQKSVHYFYKQPDDSIPVQLLVIYTIGGGISAYDKDPTVNKGNLSRTYLNEIKGYANQLRAIMGDCSRISEGMWDVLSYHDYSLKELIRKFNKCK